MIYAILANAAIVGLVFLVGYSNFKTVFKMFLKGNVCVTGLRGTGKDVVMGNVINRRNEDYVGNLDYTDGDKFHRADFSLLDCGGNIYVDFISGNVKPYIYPYPEGSDVYVSDAGIYFPAQYCSQLNNKYGSIATYQALSRQVSHNNFHFNAQNLNRVWDKIREQSDMYIRCRKCVFIGDIVFQSVTVYDKAQSCIDRVRPCRVKVPMFNKQARINAQIYLDHHYNTYGTVRDMLLIYRNKSKHDTYYFEKMMKESKNEEKENT